MIKLKLLFVCLLSLLCSKAFTNDYPKVRVREYLSLYQKVFYEAPESVDEAGRAVSVTVVTMDFVPLTVTFKFKKQSLVVINGVFSSQQENRDKSYTVFYVLPGVKPRTLLAFVYQMEELQQVGITSDEKRVVFYLLDEVNDVL